MIKLPKLKRDPKDTEHLCNAGQKISSSQKEFFEMESAGFFFTAGGFNCCNELPNIIRCRPVCKSRRREWKGQIQNTSAELLLERKPVAECFRRWPTKVYANSPCPLFGRTRRVTVNERNAAHIPNVVRICQAPVDDTAHTPYLRYAEMAKDIGAWDAVRACCAFCECGACCPCGVRDYVLRDAERAAMRRGDMRDFDARVLTDSQKMRIMYDKP